ncbi:MAG: hypothetical protein LBG87_01265 [Spirochaetaceae bacterium]|nr:hypothetical protein [Spirochaetaceae bacterium]
MSDTAPSDKAFAQNRAGFFAGNAPASGRLAKGRALCYAEIMGRAGKTRPNRRYKDSFFVSLFSDERLVLSLYNAVTGRKYSENTPIALKTLSDIFYRNLKNDLAFLLDNRLIIFFEHQSTENENIALRMFFYAAAVYLELLDLKSLYREGRVKIPRPEFYMVYIGPDEQPDMWYEDLSASFTPAEGSEEITLELRVKVININYGHKAAIMAECEALRGYSVFVAKVCEFLGSARGLSEEERKSALSRAIREAIAYCLDHDILAEYLKRHSGEVINMFTMEFDINVAEQVWKEEALEKGRKMGRAEGWQEGSWKKQLEILELINQGCTLEQLKERLTSVQENTRGVQF